jgi:hypothetical protein
MKRTVKSSGNCLGIAIALVLIVVGIAISLTGIGAIIGIPICICALFIGGKRSKVWQCRRCRAIIARG